MISLPEVDTSKGQKTVQGWLGFGIGQPTEMLFPEGSRVITHELDQDSLFPVKLGERSLDVMLDSGATVIHLDLDHLGFARDKVLPRFYNAAALTSLELTVTSAGHETKLARAVQVGPMLNAMKACKMGYAVLPTVATGLAGAVNPFAPLVPEAAPAMLLEAGFEIVEDYVDHAPRRAAAPAESLAAGADSEGFELVTHSPNGFVAYTD